LADARGGAGFGVAIFARTNCRRPYQRIDKPNSLPLIFDTATGGSVQASSATLSIDVAGTSTAQFGRLSVSSAATLDAVLKANFTSGFLPVVEKQRPGFDVRISGRDICHGQRC